MSGRIQAGVTTFIDDAFQLNDLLYLSVNHSVGNLDRGNTRGSTVHYSVPFGYWLPDATGNSYSYVQRVQQPGWTYQYAG